MKKPAEVGIIDDRCAYTYSGLHRYLGWGPAAIREARRDGLVVRRYHGKPVVLGRDLLQFFGNVEPERTGEVE